MTSEERVFIEALSNLGRRAKVVAADLDATRAALECDRATWAAREAEIRGPR